MYKNGYVLFALSFFSLFASAQTLKRQVIATSGAGVQYNGVLIQQTVGQPYNTTPNYENRTRYTPGFQQPVFKAELIKTSINVVAFPNPATFQFNIEVDKTLKDVRIQIMDISGKLIFSDIQNELKTYSVNCSEWANGAYLLNLTDADNNFYSSKILVTR